MTEPVLLGIDVGTTYCKATVVSVTGFELSRGRRRTPWRLVPTGAEIDQDALLGAVVAAAREAIDDGPAGAIAAVGVTSMAETGFLLDAAGRALHPAIAWYDTRSAPESERLIDDLGAERFSGRTGLRPGPMPTIGKYRWLRDHVPVSARGVRWLSVADLVVRSLGGAEVAERSLASRTGFLDQGSGDWWTEALAWAGLGRDLLPPLVNAGEPVGRVAPGSLPGAEGAVLAVAGHDHLAAAVGAGAVRDGDVLNSCGTAEALVRSVPSRLPEDVVRDAVATGVSVGVHIIPDRQALLAGSLCGMILQRFLDLLGVPESGRAELGRLAIAAPPGAGGLIVRSGANEIATLEGIGRDAAPGLVWRAALESVQRETGILLSAIEAVAGATERVVVVGGWSQDPAVRVVKAAMLGPFEVPEVHEAGARGAALIAGIASGFFADVFHLPDPVAERSTPDRSPYQAAELRTARSTSRSTGI